MGTDACLFADKARRYLYIGRARNFPLPGYYHQFDGWATETGIRAAIEDMEYDLSELAAAISAFVAAFPGDRYFVVSDATEPSYHDVIADFKYEEWTYE